MQMSSAPAAAALHAVRGFCMGVADIVPEFASNGKGVVRVDQLLTHTAGFPAAPFRALDWLDLSTRLRRFADWRTDWEPGNRTSTKPRRFVTCSEKREGAFRLSRQEAICRIQQRVRGHLIS